MIEEKRCYVKQVFIRLICLGSLFLSQSGYAQLINPFFKTIGVDNGLPHHKVNCILQDKRGFLWFGTEDGLSRYDGQNFTVYRHAPDDSTTLSGNIVTKLYEDRDGMLWIATRDGGISRYDYRLPANRQFKRYLYNPKNGNGIPENGINTITEDNLGYLWLGTSGSYAVRFNKKSGTFYTPVKQGTRNIYALAMGAGDTLWTGRAGGGLLKINTRNLSYQADKRYDNLYAKLPHVSITSIFKDHNNATWIGTWDKAVYRISEGGSETTIDPNANEKELGPDDFVAFAEDKAHNIWMAGKTTGLAVLNASIGQFQHFHHTLLHEGSLSDDHVNDVYADRSNNIWVATDNGVNLYIQLFSPFAQHPLPAPFSNAIIYDFYKDSANRLWLGTSEGIFIKDDHSDSFEHRTLTYKGEKLSVTRFFADSADGSFYIGTDYTLFRYNRQRNEITALPNTDRDPVMKKLIESRIVSIVRDSIDHHPALIVSPYGHCIAYYDLADKVWVSRTDTTHNILKKYNIRDNLIRKLFKDKSGNIWLATYRSGLGEWDAGNRPITYFSKDTRDSFSLSSNDVFDIQQTPYGNLWISTYGGGVNFLKKSGNRFLHMVESSNLTEGMQLDGDENLWMICNGHFHKYEKSDGIYSCYDLPRLHNTSGVSGYIYKDAQGAMYAAGSGFYISFRPSDIRRIINSPSVYFTDFKIYDKSFSQYLQQKQIELKYDDNMFSIEFAAPDYTGDNLRYSYMMEGADTNWIHAGKNSVAMYSNLKGGTYHFKVRATNWDGTYGSYYSALTIVIKSPFWERAWFIVSMMLVITALVYAIHRYRVNMLVKQQSIRNGIAQDLHDQIGSTLSSISLYSDVAKRYVKQNDNQSLEEVLDTIHLTANSMTAEIGDIVWAINPRNDDFDSVIQRINKYAKPLCDAQDIHFTLDYDPDVLKVHIGLTGKRNIFLILKESINNAIKHSGCKDLSVRIRLLDTVFEMMIKDDGRGFVTGSSKENSYQSTGDGNGLSNIQRRADELDATLAIHSEINRGTAIHIRFKVRPDV